jgi:hypothetical protein
VKVIDDSFKPHRILLELDSSRKQISSQEISESRIEVGDELTTVTVSEINFHQLTLQVADRESKKENFIMHCTSKETGPSVVKRRKKPLRRDDTPRITKNHPFHDQRGSRIREADSSGSKEAQGST